MNSVDKALIENQKCIVDKVYIPPKLRKKIKLVAKDDGVYIVEINKKKK